MFLMSEEEDLTLLKYLHEAKRDVLANHENWSLLDYTSMMIGKTLREIDNIDIEEEWNSISNKEWFSNIIKTMQIVKELYPQWQLTKIDVDRYCICFCDQCSTDREQEEAIESGLAKLKI